eukprot:1947495-Amphidinium_carterae.3
MALRRFAGHQLAIPHGKSPARLHATGPPRARSDHGRLWPCLSQLQRERRLGLSPPTPAASGARRGLSAALPAAEQAASQVLRNVTLPGLRERVAPCVDPAPP